MNKPLLFSTSIDLPPLVAILPSLEIIASVRLGEDPMNLWLLWQQLLGDIRPYLTHTYDNLSTQLTPIEETEFHEVRRAFELACYGPMHHDRIDWASKHFVDIAESDKIANYSCACSIGWINSPQEKRGFSLRLTVPHHYPYPNIAFSKHLKKGTKTIKVDGGNMAANKSSEFSCSTGDEPGVAGGIKSSTHIKEATWLTYSFDVKLEGRNACRLTDKMLMNHGNTVCLAGLLQEPLITQATALGVLAEIQEICDIKCDCQARGEGQWCISRELWRRDDALSNTSTIKAEPPFNEDLIPYLSRKNSNRTTRRRPSGSRIPDAVITDGRPPGLGNIRAVVEIKLGEDPWRRGQAEAYEDIAGSKEILLEINDQNCVCGEKEPVKEPIRVPVPDPKLVLLLALLAAIIIVATDGLGAPVIAGAGAA